MTLSSIQVVGGRAGAALAALTVAFVIVLTSGARSAAASLRYSTASNQVVQPQPAPGSCHAVGSGLYTRPDPHCTPGALNPQVTQATIASTMCRSGWTAAVRPPVRVTEPEKFASMAAYSDHRPASAYEYDHLVPLELGGATNDPRNLWPEPGATPNPKDALENELRRKVCDRQMTLVQAQNAIASNWVSLARAGSTGPPKPKPKPTTPTQPNPMPTNPSPSAPSAWCSSNARFNSTYNDYDVYVNSNQPDQTVTVTGAGTSASWHTDDTGYADVYFHADASAAGDQVTVSVGTATCTATL
jgi:hypothetical protein